MRWIGFMKRKSTTIFRQVDPNGKIADVSCKTRFAESVRLRSTVSATDRFFFHTFGRALRAALFHSVSPSLCRTIQSYATRGSLSFSYQMFSQERFISCSRRSRTTRKLLGVLNSSNRTVTTCRQAGNLLYVSPLQSLDIHSKHTNAESKLEVLVVRTKALVGTVFV